jgi:hypothetical protein
MQRRHGRLAGSCGVRRACVRACVRWQVDVRMETALVEVSQLRESENLSVSGDPRPGTTTLAVLAD